MKHRKPRTRLTWHAQTGHSIMLSRHTQPTPTGFTKEHPMHSTIVRHILATLVRALKGIRDLGVGAGIFAFVVIVTMLLGTEAALADTVPGTVTVTSPTITNHSAASVKVAGAAMVSTSSKVQLQFRVSTGFHPTHPKYHYIKAGTKYANSGTNRNGSTTWFTDTCGAGSPYTHPLTSGRHKGYCVFYWDGKLHSWRKPDCGNLVRFSNLPKLKVTSIILFRSFANVKWKDSVILSQNGAVMAMATCTTSSGSASASASASGKASIAVTVYVYAKFSFQAKAAGAHVKITTDMQSKLNVQIIATATLTMKATATVTCTENVPPPPTPSFSCTGLSATPNGPAGTLDYTFSVSAQTSNTTVTGSKYTVLNSGGNSIASLTSGTLSKSYTFPAPGTYTVQGQVVTEAGTTPISGVCSTQVTIQPPQATPPTVTATTINDVPFDGTSPNFCATAHGLGTHTGTVLFDTTYGAFTDLSAGGTNTAGGPKWTSVHDGDSVCATYVGPADSTSGTLQNTLKVFVTDNTTGLQGSTQQTFPVNEQPPGGRP